MARIKFDDGLVAKGEKLLELHDNIKAAKDFGDARQVISNYNQNGIYNQIYARQLDEKLRRDYPAFDILDSFALNLPSLTRFTFTPKPSKVSEPSEIRNLQFDQFGIIFSVLYKQNPYLKAADFILGLT